MAVNAVLPLSLPHAHFSLTRAIFCRLRVPFASGTKAFCVFYAYLFMQSAQVQYNRILVGLLYTADTLARSETTPTAFTL